MLFCLEMTALASLSLNQIDDPFSLPRGHSNVRAWDPPRLHRDRWDLVDYDLAELIFLPGLVCCLIIKGAMAINNGGILQRHCLLGQHIIRAEKNHSSRVTRQRVIVWQMLRVSRVCNVIKRCTIFDSHAVMYIVCTVQVSKQTACCKDNIR